MEYIRLAHPDEFDTTLGRFNDLVFKRSSDGGMSVFERGCAEAASGMICKHARRFYEKIIGEPVLFYLIDAEELPSGATLAHVKSDTGDDCHREVEGVKNKSLYKAFREKRGWANFKICDGDSFRDLEAADLALLA